jgi:hypothetical protein
MTAHLRMNAVYWGTTALCIMKHKEALDAEETIKYVMSCWDDEAGAHEFPTKILITLSRARPTLYTHPAMAKPLKLHAQKVPLAHTRDTTPTSFPR